MKNRVIQKYGNKKQLYIVLHILKNMKLLYDMELMISGITVYGNNDSEVQIDFEDNDRVIIDGIEHDNIQDMIREYNSLVTY